MVQTGKRTHAQKWTLPNVLSSLLRGRKYRLCLYAVFVRHWQIYLVGDQKRALRVSLCVSVSLCVCLCVCLYVCVSVCSWVRMTRGYVLIVASTNRTRLKHSVCGRSQKYSSFSSNDSNMWAIVAAAAAAVSKLVTLMLSSACLSHVQGPDTLVSKFKKNGYLRGTVYRLFIKEVSVVQSRNCLVRICVNINVGRFHGVRIFPWLPNC